MPKEKTPLNSTQSKYLEHLNQRYIEAKLLHSYTSLPESYLAVLYEKMISPYYYFEEDTTGKPTEKQISYAKMLGIDTPENYSKEELSKLIDSKKRQITPF